MLSGMWFFLFFIQANKPYPMSWSLFKFVVKKITNSFLSVFIDYMRKNAKKSFKNTIV